MDRDLVLKSVIGLSIIGLAVAAFQTYEHYFLTSTVCKTFGKTFQCSVVTQSRFGSFPPGSGIATSLWWLGLIASSYTMLKGRELIDKQDFYTFVYLVTGLGFVAYLLVAELYILPQETGRLVICPFCTIQHILIVVNVLLGYMLLEKSIGSYLTDIFYREAPETGGTETQADDEEGGETDEDSAGEDADEEADEDKEEDGGDA
ncbi:MAG: vitamin K epoxide reductase family protein [Candidatus Nanohaloarchaea archaeon]|nr:vitamin K epoxide reductase family protein [Candidatus Nanohaloarchaea archaeon]